MCAISSKPISTGRTDVAMTTESVKIAPSLPCCWPAGEFVDHFPKKLKKSIFGTDFISL